jgi:hypothetical protein
MAEPEHKDELLFSEDEEPSISVNKEFQSSILVVTEYKHACSKRVA